MRLSAAALFALLLAGVSAVAESRVIVVEAAVPVTTSSVPDDIESVEGQHRVRTSRAGAMQATGTIQVVRCEHFRNSDVKLHHFEGSRSHPNLTFHAFEGVAAPSWLPVPAWLCSTEGSCSRLPSAEIQFASRASRDWLWRWHIKGKYRAIFPDGTREEGEFKVKYLKRDPSVVCE